MAAPGDSRRHAAVTFAMLEMPGATNLCVAATFHVASYSRIVRSYDFVRILATFQKTRLK